LTFSSRAPVFSGLRKLVCKPAIHEASETLQPVTCASAAPALATLPPPCHRWPPPPRVFLGLSVPHSWEEGEGHQTRQSLPRPQPSPPQGPASQTDSGAAIEVQATPRWHGLQGVPRPLRAGVRGEQAPLRPPLPPLLHGDLARL
jgi:hypothetical protein